LRQPTSASASAPPSPEQAVSPEGYAFHMAPRQRSLQQVLSSEPDNGGFAETDPARLEHVNSWSPSESFWPFSSPIPDEGDEETTTTAASFHGRGILRLDRVLPPIEVASRLRILNLSRNEIRDIEPLIVCTSLVYLDLSRNFLQALPSGAFWERLELLEVLLLQKNFLKDWRGLTGLAQCRARYLSMKGNPIAKTPTYRPYILNLTGAGALDEFICTDEECVQGADFSVVSRFRACAPEARLPLALVDGSLSRGRVLVDEALVRTIVRIVGNVRAVGVPSIIIQRRVRSNLLGRRKRTRAAVKLQAHVRTFLQRRRCDRMLFAIFRGARGESSPAALARVLGNNPGKLSVASQVFPRSASMCRGTEEMAGSAKVARHVFVDTPFVRLIAVTRLQRWWRGLFMPVVFKECARKLKGWLRRRVSDLRTARKWCTFVRGDSPRRGRLHVYVMPGALATVKAALDVVKPVYAHVEESDVEVGKMPTYWERATSVARGWDIMTDAIFSRRKPRVEASYGERRITRVLKGGTRMYLDGHVLKQRGCKATWYGSFIKYLPDRLAALVDDERRAPRLYVLELDKLAMGRLLYHMMRKSEGARRTDQHRVSPASLIESIVAAVIVQRVWRSYSSRSRVEPVLLRAVLLRRGAICLQRFWRLKTGVKRRLRFLAIVARVMEKLTELFRANQFISVRLPRSARELLLDPGAFYAFANAKFGPHPERAILYAFAEVPSHAPEYAECVVDARGEPLPKMDYRVHVHRDERHHRLLPQHMRSSCGLTDMVIPQHDETCLDTSLLVSALEQKTTPADEMLRCLFVYMYISWDPRREMHGPFDVLVPLDRDRRPAKLVPASLQHLYEDEEDVVWYDDGDGATSWGYGEPGSANDAAALDAPALGLGTARLRVVNRVEPVAEEPETPVARADPWRPPAESAPTQLGYMAFGGGPVWAELEGEVLAGLSMPDANATTADDTVNWYFESTRSRKAAGVPASAVAAPVSEEASHGKGLVKGKTLKQRLAPTKEDALENKLEVTDYLRYQASMNKRKAIEDRAEDMMMKRDRAERIRERERNPVVKPKPSYLTDQWEKVDRKVLREALESERAKQKEYVDAKRRHVLNSREGRRNKVKEHRDRVASEAQDRHKEQKLETKKSRQNMLDERHRRRETVQMRKDKAKARKTFQRGKRAHERGFVTQLASLGLGEFRQMAKFKQGLDAKKRNIRARAQRTKRIRSPDAPSEAQSWVTASIAVDLAGGDGLEPAAGEAGPHHGEHGPRPPGYRLGDSFFR